MTSERIKEIQQETAYPNSVSVQQALLKVWNECEQDKFKDFLLNESVDITFKNKILSSLKDLLGACSKFTTKK